MKFKKVLAMTLAANMLFASSALAKTMEFTIDESNVYVSDKGITKKEIEAAPYIENGRTMVPIRVISEQFGAYVSWDGGKREVSITGGGNEIKFTIDADKAYVNGELVTLDAPATIKNGRTMVPLRFVSEVLNRSVEYVDVTKQVLISDEKPVIEINGDKIYKEDIKFLKDFYLQITGVSENRYTELVLEYIKEYITMAQKAEAEKITLSDADREGIILSCSQNSDIIYKETLVSSAAKVFAQTTLAKNYLNKLDFKIKEEDVEKYYKDNYICAKHILLLTCDPQTGEKFNTEEKNAANEKAAYALRKLKSGVSFDEVMKEFGQDPGVEYNTDGYVFTKGDMIEKFENAAYSLRVGEMTGIVESELGYHIIRRVELPEMSQQFFNELYNNMAQKEYEKLLEEEIGKSDIKVNYTIEEIVEMVK